MKFEFRVVIEVTDEKDAEQCAMDIMDDAKDDMACMDDVSDVVVELVSSPQVK